MKKLNLNDFKQHQIVNYRMIKGGSGTRSDYGGGSSDELTDDGVLCMSGGGQCYQCNGPRTRCTEL